MARAIWSAEHVNFLATLDYHHLSNRDLSTLMSKQFKMRVTVSHISALMSKMRQPGHEFYRDIPYKTAARRKG